MTGDYHLLMIFVVFDAHVVFNKFGPI